MATSFSHTLVFQFRYVGKALAIFLLRMEQVLSRPMYIHCIGFSLGAHVCGFAGQASAKYGITLDRISGLDPAGIPFYDPIPLPNVPAKPDPVDAVNARLSADDAAFVDIYHADGIAPIPVPGKFAIAVSATV